MRPFFLVGSNRVFSLALFSDYGVALSGLYVLDVDDYASVRQPDDALYSQKTLARNGILANYTRDRHG